MKMARSPYSDRELDRDRTVLTADDDSLNGCYVTRIAEVPLTA